VAKEDLWELEAVEVSLRVLATPTVVGSADPMSNLTAGMASATATPLALRFGLSTAAFSAYGLL